VARSLYHHGRVPARLPSAWLTLHVCVCVYARVRVRQEGTRPDLLATTGEFLRVWRVHDDGVKMELLLNNNKQSEFCAPLTSFDWNEVRAPHLA
jgi:hypothetical protein